MKVTRRKLAAAVLGSSAASLAQTQRTAPAADDELKAARDRLRSNAEALAGEKLPMAVEPAFQFKA
jgi:hypothetical protein